MYLYAAAAELRLLLVIAFWCVGLYYFSIMKMFYYIFIYLFGNDLQFLNIILHFYRSIQLY